VTRGSCLCGAVRYEIERGIHDTQHCHCRMCQKAHGAAFATYAAVDPRDVRFLQGEELITRYRSSKEAVRSFCSRCGSNLMFEPDATPREAWIAVGGFDTEPPERPVQHIFVDSKAPWFEIDDDLPRYPGDGE
jgi:hypothetical protein